MLDRLYLGDNFLALRKHVASESVDLVYLDPPFNSNAIYKTLAQAQGTIKHNQQVEAFSDIWRWDQDASSALDEINRGDNHHLRALTGALMVMNGRNSMMAYIVMMAVRLTELHRVLKPDGSLYLHSDSSASHHLKLMLDAIFGVVSFRREIIWRSGWVSGFKSRTSNWIRNHDTILYYLKAPAGAVTFNKQYTPHAAHYSRRGGGGNPVGKAIDDVWDDAKLYSPNIKSFSTEKLGYPTQKPIALLERIIAASSNPGDLVLDPFCGCGTTLDAAQKLGRRWIGIDKTHLAIGLTEKRMRQNYGSALSYKTIGVPHDRSTARRLAADDLDQFRAWLIFRLGAWLAGGPRKSGEAAIDGSFYFVRDGQTEAGVIVIALDPDSQATVMRRLSSLIAQGGHAMALLVTGSGSTEALRKEAASHGKTDTDFGKFPKIQTFSLELLFKGETPDLPPFVSPHRRKTRATNEFLAD